MLKKILLFLLLLGLLVGCGEPTASPALPPTAQATPKVEPTVVVPTRSPTPPPTITPTALPGVVILAASKQNDERQVQAVKKILEELAAKNGWVVESRSAVQAADITSTWKVIVFLFTPANLPDLAAAAPKVQFVVVTSAEVKTAANLTVIRLHPVHVAFLAGYLTTLIAPDWRSGGLLPSEEPSSAALQEAFLNGGRYFCGRCSPYYAPIVAFPQVTSLPNTSNYATRKAAMDELQKKVLRAVYIDPSLSSTELWNYLASLRFILVGGQPPSSDASARWAASVNEDIIEPLRSAWPEVAAGKGNKTVDAALQVVDIQAEWLSVGRQRLVEEVRQGLLNGSIAPLSPAP